MGMNGIGSNRFNTWNFNQLMNGTAGQKTPKKASKTGGVSLYAGDSNALSSLLGTDQTKAFAANYSKAFIAGAERRKQTEKTQPGAKDPEYNHKKFSTKLKHAKSPQAIRALAADIRATIADLKTKQATGEYDAEEIASAILHAEMMEQAALKRADNLEREQMAERKIKREELEELMEGDDEDENAVTAVAEEDPALAQAEEELQEAVDAEMQAMMEEMEKLRQEMAEQMSEEMEEMLAEASEEDPLQALDDMAKILGASVSEEDLEDMKKKHRAAEDMAVARADMEYLKAKFDRLQRQRDALKAGGAVGFGKGGNSPGASTGFSDGAKIVSGAVKSAGLKAAHVSSHTVSPAPSVSSPGGASSAPSPGASIDVSG